MNLVKGHSSAVYFIIIFKRLYSEITGKMSIEIDMQPSNKGRKKVDILVLCHMTKMAAMHKNGGK